MYYSCPDIGPWNTVTRGGIRQQLPPILEGQPTATSDGIPRQQQVVTDPSAIVVVSDVDHGQHAARQSSTG